MLFPKRENSATPIQLHFKELYGGSYPYTLVSEQQQNDEQEILVCLAERGTKSRHGQEQGHQIQRDVQSASTVYKNFPSHPACGDLCTRITILLGGPA